MEIWRNAKALLKLHENIIGFYKQAIEQVKPKTMKKYAIIVTQFMIFSPTLDPKDVLRFLEFKFMKKALIIILNKAKAVPSDNILRI